MSNLRLPWKTEDSLNLLYWIYIFSIQDFWITCACPGKQSVLEFFTVLNIRYTFTSFEQLSLALKNRVVQKFSLYGIYVADTFWSVHIKSYFHQKKTKSKRAMTRIKPAERQHKGRDQSSTKNVTSKTPRLHKVVKQHKVSDRSVWNPKTNCIQTKSNKIWFTKAKSKERGKEANRAEEDLKRWCHGKLQKTFH